MYRAFLLRHTGEPLPITRFVARSADGSAHELQLRDLYPLPDVAQNWPFDKELTAYHDVMTAGTTHDPATLFVGVQPHNADQVFVSSDMNWDQSPLLLAQHIEEFLTAKLF